MSYVFNKNTTNLMRPTLKEETTLASVFYLFKFTNATNVPVYCIPSDTASAQQIDRSNKFIITDTASPNPLNGEVNLSPGDYDLIIYEQSSSTNLDPTGLNEVEREIIKVVDLNASETPQYTEGEITNKIYSGS